MMIDDKYIDIFCEVPYSLIINFEVGITLLQPSSSIFFLFFPDIRQSLQIHIASQSSIFLI